MHICQMKLKKLIIWVSVETPTFLQKWYCNSRRPKQYTDKQRNLCLNIFYKSRTTYSFLRNRLHLKLPNISTLQKWTPINHLQPGFNQQIINRHNRPKKPRRTWQALFTYIWRNVHTPGTVSRWIPWWNNRLSGCERCKKANNCTRDA